LSSVESTLMLWKSGLECWNLPLTILQYSRQGSPWGCRAPDSVVCARSRGVQVPGEDKSVSSISKPQTQEVKLNIQQK